MKTLSENSFLSKYNKLSIIVWIVAGLFSTLAGPTRFTNGKQTLSEPLSTLEINNPVSKYFVMDKIYDT